MDLFLYQSGRPIWIGCHKTLAEALGSAVKNGKGKYIVFSLRTGSKGFYEVTEDGVIQQSPLPNRTTS